MTKRKKHRKSRMSGVKRRRHSVGAIDFTNILSVVAGAVAGSMVNKVVPSTVDPRLVSGGKVALGVALPMFSKSGSTKNILSGVGSGMIALGSIELLRSFAPTMFSGVDDEFVSVSLDGIGESVLAEDVLSGDIDVINGDISVVNGDDEDMDYDY
jgi:hypothetical protein